MSAESAPLMFHEPAGYRVVAPSRTEASLFVQSLHAFRNTNTAGAPPASTTSSSTSRSFFSALVPGDDDVFEDDDDGEDYTASEDASPGSASFRLYRRRWFMLAIFCAFSASNSMAWLSYGPIADLAATIFASSTISIHALGFLVMITYVFLAGPAGAYTRARGLRHALCLGAALNLTGAALKIFPWPLSYAVNSPSTAYFCAFLGTFLQALAQLFTLNTPVLLAQAWFGAHERVTATAIASSANAAGCAFAFGLVPLVLGSEPNATSVQDLLIVHLLLVGGATFLVYQRFQSRPPTPPSFSAMAESHAAGAGGRGAGAGEFPPAETAEEHASVEGFTSIPTSPITELRSQQHSQALASSSSLDRDSDLFTICTSGAAFLSLVSHSLLSENRAFLLVAGTFSILQGLSLALLILLSSLLASSGFAHGFIATCGVAFILASLVGNLTYGLLGDTPTLRAQKKHLIGLALILSLFGSFGLFCLPWLQPDEASGSNGWVLLMVVLMGLGLNAPEAMMLDLAVENTYPAPSEATTLLVLVGANGCGVILASVLAVAHAVSSALVGLLCMGVLLAPLLAWRSYTGQHRRFEMEKQAQRIADTQVGFTPSHAAASSASSAGSHSFPIAMPVGSSAKGFASYQGAEAADVENARL
jgi:hypothetical protein